MIPFVPTIVSMITAATFCGPSYWRGSSRCGEVRPSLVRHRRPDRGQLVGLFLDRRDDLRVLVADRDVDELRGEVEVAVALGIPEVAALAAGDHGRVELVLHRPGVEDVLLVE